jgi:hypothetical protein
MIALILIVDSVCGIGYALKVLSEIRVTLAMCYHPVSLREKSL